jgi:hypothetical protein
VHADADGDRNGDQVADRDGDGHQNANSHQHASRTTDFIGALRRAAGHQGDG